MEAYKRRKMCVTVTIQEKLNYSMAFQPVKIWFSSYYFYIKIISHSDSFKFSLCQINSGDEHVKSHSNIQRKPSM